MNTEFVALLKNWITCLFCCFEFYIYHVELENISLNYRYIRVNDFFSLDVIECKTTFFRMSFLKEIGWHIGCSIRYSAVHGFRVHIWTTNLSVFCFVLFVCCLFCVFSRGCKRHLSDKSLLIQRSKADLKFK